MGFHNALHNGQTQPCSRYEPCFVVLHTVEPVEYVLRILRRNADARVRNADSQIRVFHRRLNRNLSPLRGVLDRVAEQVGQNLVHVPPVPQNRGKLGEGLQSENNVFLQGLGLMKNDLIFEKTPHVQFLFLLGHQAGFNLRKIQEF